VAKREAGEFEFTSLVHSAAVDPDLNLTTNLACGQVGNWVRYCNKDFDKVLTDARSTYDPKQRHEAYKKAQAILYEDVPDNFFWSLPYIYAYNKKVQGFVPSWTEYFELRGIWLQ
jgi:peptide/nickel transport system substrate-binding protein